MALLSAMGLLTIAQYVVASLDVRWSWSPQVPFAVRIAGLVVVALGYDGLLVWAMVSNAFFVATVRHQSERGQTVVSRGPYHYVRHPGYLGTLLMYFGAPFLLDSLWAVIPAVLNMAVLIVRTALEDRMLHAELPGYEEYADRVRWRLLPGVW